MRQRPLIQKLFFALILATIVATPILLLVAGDDEYEGLEIRSAKLQAAPGETRLSVVLDNDGDRRVRITDVTPVKPGSTGMVLADLEARYNPRGDIRANLRKFTRFEMDPQQQRFIEVFRKLEACDDDPETVRDLRVTYEVFGGTQERVLRLPDTLQLPRCS